MPKKYLAIIQRRRQGATGQPDVTHMLAILPADRCALYPGCSSDKLFQFLAKDLSDLFDMVRVVPSHVKREVPNANSATLGMDPETLPLLRD